MTDNEFIFETIIFIVFSIFLVLYIGIQSDKYSCKRTANTLGYSCEYSVWTGCILVKPDGSKMLLEQLREIR